jgi:tetratricopeptide (TPR) repeat protein
MNWEWTRAEPEYQRAISLQPSSWQARAAFADYRVAEGRFAEARQLIDEVNGLSPLDVAAQCLNVYWGPKLTRREDLAQTKSSAEWASVEVARARKKATVDYFERRWNAVLSPVRRRHEIDPDNNFVSLDLASTLFRTGQIAESIALYKNQIKVLEAFASDPSRDYPREDLGYRYTIRSLGYTYGAIHDIENARDMLARLANFAKTHPVPSFDYALIYAGMCDRDMAFKYLEQSYREHSQWMQVIKVEPMFESLHGDPRFADLVRRVGLT